MFNPPHPGEILKELYMDPLGIQQKVLASGIGVTRKALSELINGHTSMSTKMAFLLSEAFDTTPEFWLNLQIQHSVYNVRRNLDLSDIKSFRTHEKQGENTATH